MPPYNCIVVLGATASGKTRLACQLAYELNGEIISADSRQVYKHLNIGTGKDLNEYVVKGKKIPFHLIDIVEPQEQFYLHQFAGELKKAFEHIRSYHKIPVICGGTGLYLDALRKDFSYTLIKEDKRLRRELDPITKEELITRIKTYPEPFVRHVDFNSRKRIIRGIEIAEYLAKHGNIPAKTELPYNPYYIGITSSIEIRKQRIANRLEKRMDEGLIKEVEGLLEMGVTHQRLELFGLEYKYISRYLKKELTSDELHRQLQTAIFQFAKRQMTWFRKMEKEGVEINWTEKGDDLLPLIKELFG